MSEYAEDVAVNLITDPDTEAVSVVGRGPDGALLALEFGDEDLAYKDMVELAAYHLISLEDQSEKPADATLRDVIHRRNEIQENRDVSGGDADE